MTEAEMPGDDARRMTDRKQIEEDTRPLTETVALEKEQLAALVNSISDEIWFANTKGEFTLTNPAATQEFKLTQAQPMDIKEFAGTLEVFRADGSPRPVEEAPALRALRGEVMRNLEEIIRTPATGELRYRQVSASPVRDNCGATIGSVAVVRDITAQKQVEEQLRQRTKELTKANAELTHFNSMMVGRELRMVELKKEIDKLCRQFGQPTRYGYDTD